MGVSGEPQGFLAFLIVLCFVGLTVFQVLLRPDNIIMPDTFLIITTVAICYLMMGGARQ